MTKREMGHGRTGGVLIFTIFGLMFISGLMAMVTDVGWMYYQKARLQSGVNAAWKAGYDEQNKLAALNNGKPLSDSQNNTVKERVKDVFQRNGYSQEDANALNINFTLQQGMATRLEVSSNKTFGLFFANILDMSAATVNSSRGANSLGGGNTDDGTGGAGVVPLGVMHGDIVYGDDPTSGNPNAGAYWYKKFTDIEGFQPGQEYIIRMGGSNMGGNNPHPKPPGYDDQLTTGGNSNEGSLRFPNGSGKDVWGDNFVNGYPGTINLNDVELTEPGGAAGPVDSSLRTRLDSGKTRVIVPIIAVPGTEATVFDESGISSVKVIGFAEFELTDPNTGDHRTELGDYVSLQIRGTFVRYIVNPNDVPQG